MKPLILAGLSLILIAADAPVAADAPNQSLNAFYERVFSESNLDIRSRASAFHPQGLFVFLGNRGQPGPVTAGSELAARLEGMSARMAADGMTIMAAHRIERRSIIGDTAVDTGYMRTTQTRNGVSQNFYARFLITMIRGEDGQWRIVSDAAWPADEAAWDAVPRAEGLIYDT